MEREQNPQVYARTQQCPPTATIVRFQIGEGFNSRGKRCFEVQQHINGCPYCLGKARIIEELGGILPSNSILEFMKAKEEKAKEKTLVSIAPFNKEPCQEMEIGTLIDYINCNQTGNPVKIGEHIRNCPKCSKLISHIIKMTDLANNEPSIILR